MILGEDQHITVVVPAGRSITAARRAVNTTPVGPGARAE